MENHNSVYSNDDAALTTIEMPISVETNHTPLSYALFKFASAFLFHLFIKDELLTLKEHPIVSESIPRNTTLPIRLNSKRHETVKKYIGICFQRQVYYKS